MMFIALAKVIIKSSKKSEETERNQTMVKVIDNRICHLGEGPLWNVGEQKLYWTDILNGKIYQYNPETKQTELFWSGDMQVGGFSFNKDGALMLCSDQGVFKLQDNQISKIFDIKMKKGERFNDIIADPKGRIFAGTLKSSLSDGILYRIEQGKEPVVVLKNIGISNGMCFSADSKFFFHTDSMARTITRFNYDSVTGNISSPKVIYQGTEANGFPDGMTMDAEGQIWIACWAASKVIRITTEGEITKSYPIPAMQPSSLTFGGSNLQTLYVTSACQGGTNLEKGEDDAGEFLGGHTYEIDLKVKGRSEYLSDF